MQWIINPDQEYLYLFVLHINQKVYLTVNNTIQIKERIFRLTVVLSPVNMHKYKTAELCVVDTKLEVFDSSFLSWITF